MGDRRDVPWDEWVSADGMRLHVRSWPGDGTPFLLLHGLASNCRTWEAVARGLNGAGHRIVTVDQRGHGLSDKPAYGYGFEDVTSDLLDLVEGLDFGGRPIIAGQSWGGNVVLDFAARYPGVAGGIVLVDGGFLEPSARPGATWEGTAVDLMPPPLAGRPRVELAERLRRAHPDWSEEGIDATLGNFETLPDDTIRPWLALDHHMEILRAMWDHHPPDLYGRVAEAVLIAPAEDAGDPERLRIKRAMVKKAEMGLARCRVRWFPGTDHDIHVHRPAELAEAMLEAVRDGLFG